MRCLLRHKYADRVTSVLCFVFSLYERKTKHPGFLLSVCHVSPGRAKHDRQKQGFRLPARFNRLYVVCYPYEGNKRHTIKTKYHAAAGKNTVSESPKKKKSMIMINRQARSGAIRRREAFEGYLFILPWLFG